jgi:hypothetical protein
MPTIQDIPAERLAKLFHHYHEALAQDGSADREADNSTSWESTPLDERKRMVAAARLAILELSAPPPDFPARKYFATPGEADWGC